MFLPLLRRVDSNSAADGQVYAQFVVMVCMVGVAFITSLAQSRI